MILSKVNASGIQLTICQNLQYTDSEVFRKTKNRQLTLIDILMQQNVLTLGKAPPVNCRIKAVFPILLSPTTTTDILNSPFSIFLLKLILWVEQNTFNPFLFCCILSYNNFFPQNYCIFVKHNTIHKSFIAEVS